MPNGIVFCAKRPTELTTGKLLLYRKNSSSDKNGTYIKLASQNLFLTLLFVAEGNKKKGLSQGGEERSFCHTGQKSACDEETSGVSLCLWQRQMGLSMGYSHIGNSSNRVTDTDGCHGCKATSFTRRSLSDRLRRCSARSF